LIDAPGFKEVENTSVLTLLDQSEMCRDHDKVCIQIASISIYSINGIVPFGIQLKKPV
jgi:hypothetical protein